MYGQASILSGARRHYHRAQSKDASRLHVEFLIRSPVNLLAGLDHGILFFVF